METATPTEPSAEEVERKELEELHTKAMTQLEHKLSRIPAGVFHSNRKPTIIDIYTANAAALHVTNIPAHLQLDFVFENYPRFAATDFKALKAKGADDVNMAIWFWQMDQGHSFSRRHTLMRTNILMACIMCMIPEPKRYIDASALEFCTAFLDAWNWSVGRHDNFDKQRDFLSLWVNGPYELMHLGSSQRKCMEKKIKELEQYVPKKLPPVELGQEHYWQGLEMLPKHILSKYGPAWAVKHVLWVEELGREIDQKQRHLDGEEALAEGTWMAEIGGVGIGVTPSGLTRDVFERPLVQSLMKEDGEDVDMEDGAKDASGITWLDPVVALKLLDDIVDQYETMKGSFNKIEWRSTEA